MKAIEQKVAVANAINQVLKEAGISITENSYVKDIMTKELRAQVNQILFEGFKAGTIRLTDTPSNRAKLEDPKKLRSYVSGLQSNWLDKHDDLTGGVEYVVKNPGSRKYMKDPEILNMRNLKSILATDAEKEEVQAHINDRIAFLDTQTKKAKQKPVDVNALPEALRNKITL